MKGDTFVVSKRARVIVALLEDKRFSSDGDLARCSGETEPAKMNDELSSRVPGQTVSSTARVLSPEELRSLADERGLVSDFKQLKLEREAQKNWDLFYKRNSTHFFKDRHWTTREFEELKACREVFFFLSLYFENNCPTACML